MTVTPKGVTIASSRIQLTKALLTATNLHRLCDEVVRFLQAEFHTRTITIFLFSKKGLLVPAANAGTVPSAAASEAYAPGEDVVGRCVSGKAGEAYGERVVQRFGSSSAAFQHMFGGLLGPETEIVYLPLNGVNRTYGVIRCIAGRSRDGKEKAFSDDDLKDLDVYAHQAGVSISSLREKSEITVLNNANKLLAVAPHNVGGVYELITEALIAESTEFAACSIRIRDRGGELRLESLNGARGMNMLDKERTSRRHDTGLAAEVFKDHKPKVIHNVQENLDWFYDPNWLRANGIQTAAVFPIYLDDDNIGVLALYLWYHYEFYNTKVEFLQSLCRQVATATRVVQHLAARQQLVERTSEIVSHAGKAGELLQTILNAACELTGAWQGYISLIRRHDGKLHPKVTTHHLSADDIPPIDINGEGLTALAVRTKHAVRRGDVQDDPEYVDFLGDAQGKARSEIVVPLVPPLKEHVLGVIALQSDQVQYFKENDELLLETLAQYATLIFQRDRYNEGTEKLAKIDFSRANRKRVMSVIAATAVELVDADAAILRTYNSATSELVLESYHPRTMSAEHVPQALPSDVGACWDALRIKDVLKFDNLPENHLFHNRAFVMSNGFTDMVSVPLLLPGEDAESPSKLGVINIFFRAPSPFFDVERQLLLALGVSASYAIHDLSIIEKANRAQSLATITAQTTAAVELSSKLARQALRPLHEARLAMEAISRAHRRQDLVGIPTPLGKLENSIGRLESLLGQLAPRERTVTRAGDYVEILSDAFRLMHTNLFASSGRPHLNIGEGELWEDIKAALRRVIDLVRLPIAAAYISSHRDYSSLRRVVVTRNNAAGADTINLPTFDEFAWLAEQPYVTLPREDDHFSWLDPQTVLGTPKIVLYGHEVTGGRLMAVALGVDKDRTLSYEDLATLYESVAVQIFTYVDNAMFGIELDFLTSETGHLMGRAIGKVESGTSVLEDFLSPSEQGDAKLLSLAKSAVDDGLTRLKLIHNNFYWFSAQRRLTDSPSVKSAGADQIDVYAMLRDMLPMFRREAYERGLMTTRFQSWIRAAAIRGPEDLLGLLFLNLYDNALKFAYARTFIEIRLSRENDHCVVEFENLGVGVAPDEVKTVFERLRRSRYRDPSRRVEGLGLGLAYCRRVVEEIFHGHISLASRPADLPKGERFEGDNWLTTVTVKLPLMKEIGRKGRRV